MIHTISYIKDTILYIFTTYNKSYLTYYIINLTFNTLNLTLSIILQQKYYKMNIKSLIPYNSHLASHLLH